MSDKEKSTRSDVQASAYRFLSRRDHGREELARKLRRRDYPDDLIEPVLDELEDVDYLDDSRFCHDQAQILARKCWGPRQIAHKLRARGIDDGLIDECLEQIGQSEDWRERASEKLHSRFGPHAELDDADQRRAYRHLTYRGYAPGLVRSLLFDN